MASSLSPLAASQRLDVLREQLQQHALAYYRADAPLLPDDLFPRLVAAAGTGAAYAETAEGRQPMCAVWPVAALPALEAALARAGAALPAALPPPRCCSPPKAPLPAGTRASFQSCRAVQVQVPRRLLAAQPCGALFGGVV